jgi:hypothetical protein
VRPTMPRRSQDTCTRHDFYGTAAAMNRTASCPSTMSTVTIAASITRYATPGDHCSAKKAAASTARPGDGAFGLPAVNTVLSHTTGLTRCASNQQPLCAACRLLVRSVSAIA